MLTSFDKFISYQLKHQYKTENENVNKRQLDFRPFREEMEKMTDERFHELNNMLIEVNLEDVQKKIRNKLLNYQELTLFYLKRILLFDENNLNSIIELNPDALKLAKICDEDKTNNKSLIFGMPIIIKDNISSGDQMHNSSGSISLIDSKPEKAAPIIKRLKSKGGIILAKANMSEWAFSMSSRGVCGYTALGGQCHNPYGKFAVGGSSTGSAISVSSNLCMLSIGTETNGSLTNPSGQNSIVAIYPTKGVLPNELIIPVSKSLDTPGPMARTVEDAAALLWAITKEKEILKIDYNELFIVKKNNYKIGIISNDGILESRRTGDLKELNRIKSELEKIGHEVIDIKIDEEVFDIKMDSILEYEFNESVKVYLKNIKEDKIKNLSDVIELYEKNMESYAPYGYDIIKESIETNITKEENTEIYEENRKKCRKGIDDALEQVDVLMSLSSHFSGVYASAGYPSVIVPAGYRSDGEPVGLTFTASAYQESKLINIAYIYEKSFSHRKSPIKAI